MPLPPFDSSSDERQMPLGVSLTTAPLDISQQSRLDARFEDLCTASGVQRLVSALGRRFAVERFAQYLGEDKDLVVPLVDILVVYGVLDIDPANRLRVCEASGLLPHAG